MKHALTIAGSDSGGGAGIQADLKAFHAHGVYGTSVITAVTAQNTVEVRRAFDLPGDLIRAQLEAVLDDIPIAAAKTGMLSSPAIIDAVADILDARAFENLVVDAVMVSKSGFRLLRDDAVEALVRRLIRRARVVTPNLHEASLLVRMPITSLDEMKRAAESIGSSGARAVVVKGGHARFALAVDVLWTDEGAIEILRPDGKVEERSVHGTGCTFSAAITARIALGDDVVVAVRNAKRYITRVIRHASAIGSGHAVGDSFYFLDEGDWEKK